ncbi:MAG: sigma-70 family RNA polymerase sigma factor [Bacteroidales bacterium]|nr:sigma-70 family RNA polymerase sigma factor [Bacteroidales bacterium]
MEGTVMSHKKKRYNEFEEMLCRSQRILYHVCLAYTDKQPESIDDLYQEIVSNLWHGWPKFRGKSDTATWVYRVALNTAKSELRKLQRRGDRDTVPIDARLCDTLADEAADPRIERLYSLIDLLPADEKELVFLYLDDLTHAQIAAVTGTSEGAAKQHIYRIRQKLILLNSQENERE